MRMLLLLVGLNVSPLFGLLFAADPVPGLTPGAPMPVAPMPPASPFSPEFPPPNQPPGVPPPGFGFPPPLAPMPPQPGALSAPMFPVPPPANPPLGIPPAGPGLPLPPGAIQPNPAPAPDYGPSGAIGKCSIFAAKPREPAPGDDELQRLLIARYNAAINELKTTTSSYQAGVISFDSIINSAGHVLQAGMELNDKPADQIAMIEGYIEFTKHIEAQVKALYDSRSRGGEADKMYQATYLRLGGEIQLLLAKRKAGLVK